MEFLTRFKKTVLQLEFYLQQSNHLSDEYIEFQWQCAWEKYRNTLHFKCSAQALRRIQDYIASDAYCPQKALSELRTYYSLNMLNHKTKIGLDCYSSNIDAILGTIDSLTQLPTPLEGEIHVGTH